MRQNVFVASMTVGLLAFTCMPITSGQAANDSPAAHPETKQGVGTVMERAVRSQAEHEISQQRKKIMDEALPAIVETKNAIKALEKKKSQDALKALERATGKLNIMLARDPKLKLAPITVDVSTQDLYTTVDQIQKDRKQAAEYLEDGEVYKARMLIRGLASEIVITVSSIPLKTYTVAITAAVPLIDQGKIEDAKAALQTALDTLVVTEHIIPLPLVRAEENLVQAEALAQKATRSEEDNTALAKLLNEARAQLKLSEILGYGTKNDYEKFYAEIKEIEDKTQGGKSAQGLFGPVNKYLSDLRRSIFG